MRDKIKKQVRNDLPRDRVQWDTYLLDLKLVFWPLHVETVRTRMAIYCAGHAPLRRMISFSHPR
jgi:hypothetical protein